MSNERQAKITTPLGEDLLLLHMSGQEALGRMFHYQVSLRGQKEDIDPNAIIGKAVCVEVETEDDESRYFHGFVSRFSQQGRSTNYANYSADIRPWLWFLTRNSDCRIFQEMTVPDIIKEIFDIHGFSDYEFRLNSGYRTWEYCVQYRESDFNFVSRLMEQEGIYYYFLHKEDKHTLVLTEGYSGHDAIAGESEIAFHHSDTGVRHGERSISNWASSCELQPGTYALKDYDFKKPKSDLSANRAIPREHANANYEIYDYPGEYTETSDGEQYALARIEELHANFAQVGADTDARSMSCGGLFTLAEHPRDDQNAEYLVTEAQYDVAVNDYSSAEAEAQEPFQCSFAAILSSSNFRSQRTTAKPAVQGPQTAKVVGPAGEEIFPDEFGRVKVQFHWDRYGESNENSSCWIRVGQTWAGPGFGSQFIPRIGHEVIVDFLEGDPDRPLITGVVYNADNMPPYSLPGSKTQSGIKTRSSPGGSAANCNEIRLEDKAGSEEFYVQAEKDYNQVVKNNRTESIGVDRSLDVGNDKSESVGNDRTENITNNNSLTVGNDETISIGANETITVGANHAESIGADKSLEVGGNHSESIGSNMSVNVGSNLTETVAINYAETVGVAMELTIGAAFTETVGAAKIQSIGAAKSVNVGANSSENIGSNKSVSTGGNLSVSVGGSHSEKTTKDYSLNAKKVTINADEEISIVTGKASITMKKDGTFNINGKNVDLTASGKMNAKASKNLTMKGKKILQN